MSVMNNVALGFGYGLIAVIAWSVVMATVEWVKWWWRSRRKEPERDEGHFTYLSDQLKRVVGTDDPHEIRRMLDQAWETREPKSIVPGPGNLVDAELARKVAKERASYVPPEREPTAKELAARLGKSEDVET